ncbi:DUF6286 domain-containing protein [Streptomyces sp. NPDC102360]|uniref:DUF6286 domain-containing protein n=1 Tax=Streptomyces sp. NPDC102360 TaxID=3366160 RepID=UPI003820BCBB
MTTAARRGTTTVSDKAVRAIAARAAHELAPQPAAAAKGSAAVRGRRADVAVRVTLPYPSPLSETVGRLQEHVTSRTRELTGLQVSPVRVEVTSLAPARPDLTSASASASASKDTPATAERSPRRWWSQRRVPMASLTLVASLACGALALDLILVHVAHHPPATWRVETLSWLSRHGPAAPSVTIGAGALAALGVLMVVLALTPGRRNLLTLTSPAHRLRAVIDRSAVELLVRDAASLVPGIERVRVRVRRRRIRVHADLAFGDRAETRESVRAAARATLDACHLRHAPRLRIRIHCPPTAKQPDAVDDTTAEHETEGTPH